RPCRDALRPQPRRGQPLAAGGHRSAAAGAGLPGAAGCGPRDPGLNADRELRRVRAEDGSEQVPAGFELDPLTYPGGQMVLAKAREVMTAILTGERLPLWFTAQCVDDRAVQTCTLDRWSLRAWRYWLEPENR